MTKLNISNLQYSRPNNESRNTDQARSSDSGFVVGTLNTSPNCNNSNTTRKEKIICYVSSSYKINDIVSFRIYARIIYLNRANLLKDHPKLQLISQHSDDPAENTRKRQISLFFCANSVATKKLVDDIGSSNAYFFQHGNFAVNTI